MKFGTNDVTFVAVSCDHHNDICNQYEVEGFPTLIAFAAGTTSIEEGTRLEQNSLTPIGLAQALALEEGRGTTVSASVETNRLRRRMDDNFDDDANAGGDDDEVGGGGDDDEVNNAGGDDDQQAGGTDDDVNNASDDDQAGGSKTDDDVNAGDDDQAGGGGGTDDEVNAGGDDDQAGGVGNDDEVNGGGDDDQAGATENDDEVNGSSGGGLDDDQLGRAGDDDTAQNAGGDDKFQNNNGDDNVENGDDDANLPGEPEQEYSEENEDDDQQQRYSEENEDDDAAQEDDDDPVREEEDMYRAANNLNPVPKTVNFNGNYNGIGGRRPEAGAIKARTGYKDMDRFQSELRAKTAEYDKKRKGVGKLLRKDARKDRRGQPIIRQNQDAMTKTMRLNAPGTEEYNKRMEQITKRIQKVQKQKAPVQLTKEALPYKKDVRKETLVKKTAERLPLVKRLVKLTPEEELILDVSVSLVAVLETGTFLGVREGGLPVEKKHVLQDFLDLLNVSFPPEWGIHKLIDDLRRRIAYVATGDKALRNVINEHPLPRKGWSNSCTHGLRRSSGFSCGLWKLFHVVSVGVAEQRGGLNLRESGMVGSSTRLFSPIEAADTISSFIENFFSCKSCAKHFVEHYENCDNNRRCDRLTEDIEDASTADWKELPLWLWEVHNEVSIHVVHQQVERNNKMLIAGAGNVKATRRATMTEQVQAIWPNVETCILCFKDDGTWDEPEVFRLLEKSYW